MIFTRRTFVIKSIAAVGGGALLVSCKGEGQIEPTDLEVSGPKFYSAAEFALITRLSDLIIPRTETPGALDVGVPAMMDGLMAGWASRVRRKAQRETLAKIKSNLDKIVKTDFNKAPIEAAGQALLRYDTQAFNGAPGFPAYGELKFLIESVYAASEGGAVDEYRNDPVPGRWEPRVPLSQFKSLP